MEKCDHQSLPAMDDQNQNIRETQSSQQTVEETSSRSDDSLEIIHSSEIIPQIVERSDEHSSSESTESSQKDNRYVKASTQPMTRSVDFRLERILKKNNHKRLDSLSITGVAHNMGSLTVADNIESARVFSEDLIENVHQDSSVLLDQNDENTNPRDKGVSKKKAMSENRKSTKPKCPGSPATPGDQPCTSETPKRKTNFSFLNETPRQIPSFGSTPRKRPSNVKGQTPDKKLTRMEKQLETSLSSTPNSQRKSNRMEYEITGIKFTYMRVSFDIDVLSTSGRTSTKSTIALEDVVGGFESAKVKQFREENPEEFQNVFDKYIDYQKDEAEARKIGVIIETCKYISYRKSTGAVFCIKNTSTTHDIYYSCVVESEGVKIVEGEKGRVPKKSEVWISMRTHSERKKKDSDCVWVGWHWGEDGHTPRLTQKIAIKYVNL